MKHDWNAWLKNRVLREARAPRNFKFEFEEEELQVVLRGNRSAYYRPDIIDVKFIIEADWNEEEPMVKYGDSPYPGSPAHWEWDIQKVLKVHPEGLNIPENEIIDSLRKRMNQNHNMQERLSDEAAHREGHG